MTRHLVGLVSAQTAQNRGVTSQSTNARTRSGRTRATRSTELRVMAAAPAAEKASGGSTDDDAEALRRHGSLEVASLRAAVMHEIRRSYDAMLSTREPDRLLEMLVGVVDSVVGHETEGIVAFHVLLLQRLAKSTSTDSPSIDRGAINDRAALLQVRLALEQNEAATSAPTVAKGARPSVCRGGEQSPKGRPSAVRWSLAGGDHNDATPRRSVPGAGSAQPPSGSRLCKHALEALRGSVKAMEDEQQPVNAPSSCRTSEEQPSTEDATGHRRRSSVASSDSAPSLSSSVLGSDDESARHDRDLEGSKASVRRSGCLVDGKDAETP